MSADFLCEHYLKKLSPDLHERYRNSVFAIDKLLTNYKLVFPFFTNHTFEHSSQVINYCNILAGEENVPRLNADELYILLMGACLHDVGMGVSEHDYQIMSKNIKGLDAYVQAHPTDSIGDVTRAFHQEFSAEFIKKYRNLFEIPSDKHVFCICQVARGHRKLNLLDENEFPAHFMLDNGNEVHLPYLAGLVKLSDEMDMTADRNLLFNYEEFDPTWQPATVMCFKCHKAIRYLEEADDMLALCYSSEEEDVCEEIASMEKKVQQIFRELEDVVRERTDFTMVHKGICYKKIP